MVHSRLTTGRRKSVLAFAIFATALLLGGLGQQAANATHQVVTIDDTVMSNGSRGRVSGTITCDAGEVFKLQLSLAQGVASAEGSTRGTCTGSPQPFQIDFTAGGGSFSDGSAEACVAARTAVAGSRTFHSAGEVCEEVTVEGTGTTTSTSTSTSTSTTSTTMPPSAWPTASGAGVDSSGATFSFTAANTGPGDRPATGTWEYVNNERVRSGTVNCLEVVGNVATFMGIVTEDSSPPGGVPLTGEDYLEFAIEDNGESGDGFLLTTEGGAPPFLLPFLGCGDTPASVDQEIQSGSIVITQP